MAPKKRPRVTRKAAEAGKAAGGSSAEDEGKRKASPKADVTESAAPSQYCHWLMKSEPESRFENGVDVKFGIEDLKALPDQTGCWDGVRNYQARNFMRQMKEGQLAFFYHSNCKEPGIAGVMKTVFCLETVTLSLAHLPHLLLQIVKEAYVDHTQFDKKDVHFDASSKPDNPKWSMVDVQYQRMMKRFIPLSELKKYHQQHMKQGGTLKNMALFTRARLSVQPLTAEEFAFVVGLEDEEPL